MEKMTVEKPGLSNSRLESQSLGNDDFKISLDRLTVVGEISDKKASKSLSHYLQYNPHVQVLSAGYDRFRGQIGDVFIEYDKLKGQAFGRSNFRIEFNPNKIDSMIESEILRILSFVSAKDVTRLDLAFDTTTIDLSEFRMYRTPASKHTLILGRNGALETHYLGSRNSDKFVRIYDKKQELKDKHDTVIPDKQMWRLEFELKRKMARSFMSALDGFAITKPDWRQLQNMQEKAMVYLLLQEEAEWGKLSKNSKTKYKKIISSIESENLVDELRDLLRKYESDILKYLNKFIK